MTFCGCDSSGPDPYFAGVEKPAVERVEDIRNVTLELTGQFGKRDSTPWFGRIIALAAHPSGLLAVADADRCRITLIDTSDESFRELGGCGEGPGEFLQLDYVTFHGDTIVAFDRGNRQLVYLDFLGNEIRRLRPRVLSPTMPFFASLASWNDTMLVGGVHLIPAKDPGSDHLLLAIFNSADGAPSRRFVGDSPISQANDRPLLRSVRACANRLSENPRLAVANVWAPQVITFIGDELKIHLNVTHELAWWQPQAQANPMEWLPPIPHPGLACGREYFLVMYKRQVQRPDDRWVITDGMVSIRTYDGEVVYRKTEHLPGPGSILMYTAGAAVGDRFYVYTNYFDDHPIVREYTLVKN